MAGDLFTLPFRFGLRTARGAVRSGVGSAERAVGMALSVASAVRPGGAPSRGAEPAAPSSEQPSSAPSTGERDQQARQPPGENVDAGTRRNGHEPHEQRQAQAGEEPAPEEPSYDPRSQAHHPEPPTPAQPLEPNGASAASSAAPQAPPPAPVDEAPALGPPEEVAHVSEEATLVESFAEPGAEDGAGAQVSIAEPWEGYSRMKAEQAIGRADQATDAELAAAQLYELSHRNRGSVLTALERALAQRRPPPGSTTAETKEPADG